MKSKLFGILFIGIALTGCKKYLDVYPETSLSSETFFKKEADFQQAINAAYVPLRPIFNDHNWVLGELHSDNSYYARNVMFGAEEQTQNHADFNLPLVDGLTTNTRVRDLYRLYYQVIARTNQVLFSIDEIDFDATSKNNIKGQAYFLRGFAYLELTRFFGKVPLHLTPIKDRSEAAVPLAETEALYTQIESDLKEATQLLKNKTDQEAGRVTSGSAWTALANLYLIQKRWEDAEDAAEAVITSNQYSLIGEYEDVFSTSTENKNNEESVFEVQYMEGSGGYQSSFIYAFMPRPISIDELKPIFQTSNTTSLAEEGKNIPTPDLIAAYEANDKRKDATIAYVTISGSQRANKTYPYIRKYAKPHAVHGNTGINWPVYRYAEVLLFMAEALNEQDKTGDAATFLNRVRNRAGLPNTTASGKEAMREAILRERRVELAFENKRWNDIVRMDKIQEIIVPYGERVKANPLDYYYPDGYSAPSNAFTNLEKYFGLPADEAALTPHF